MKRPFVVRSPGRIQLNEAVAVERPTEPTKYAPTALAFLERLELFASQLQLGPEYLAGLRAT